MRLLRDNFGWEPIESAPLDTDLRLQVIDDQGVVYRLASPFRLTVAGWVSTNKGTPLAVTPIKWKPYL